ncbi:hypothetical protein PR048_021806 [Dryococelus australis]|uniref:Uncharacterized protein n=1 Tax=Dryococelus australis TaxID=614101 RepID=A0ABQ9GZ79_9NEOP|nr:hypothetical protein PR048_021806 [Dryococelus australis]
MFVARFHTPSQITGILYWMTTNDFSRFRSVYYMRQKYEVQEKLKQFLKDSSYTTCDKIIINKDWRCLTLLSRMAAVKEKTNLD